MGWDREQCRPVDGHAKDDGRSETLAAWRRITGKPLPMASVRPSPPGIYRRSRGLARCGQPITALRLSPDTSR
jgi:hypothetical protein